MELEERRREEEERREESLMRDERNGTQSCFASGEKMQAVDWRMEKGETERRETSSQKVKRGEEGRGCIPRWV